MNPDIIQFQCSACQSVLTVPAQLAGVSGPCPTCGQTVTSPMATAAFGAAISYEPSSMAAPAYMQPPAPASPMLPPGGPVLPMPHSISPHLPQYGVPAASTFLPNAPAVTELPQQAPPWSQPGFGQTMIQPTMQAPAAEMPTMMGMQHPGVLLPTAGLNMPTQNPQAWGAGSNLGLQQQPDPSHEPMVLPQRNAANQGHSSLIPGSPTLAKMGGFEVTNRESLLGQGMPAQPIPEIAQGFVPPNLPASAAVMGRSRPFKKPRRTSNLFMVGLAIVFLGLFLFAGGWFFREPIMQLVERFAPNKVNAQAGVGSTSPDQNADNKTPLIPVEDLPSEPKMAVGAAQPVTSAFDPAEVMPLPLKAEPVSSEEIARATKPSEATPSLTEAPALKPGQMSADNTSLLEVTKATEGGAKQGTSADSAIPTTRQVVILNVPAEAKPAADALAKFFAAENLQERLIHTLAVESMKPLMEQYYGLNAEGPIIVDAISLVRFDPKPQLGAGAHAVFGVESKTWESAVPVMLEERDGSFKVDWLSFVEFKDHLLEKYIHTYQEGPARFHVGLTRTHYFEDKVPNSSSKEAFRITSTPSNPFAATIFVDKDSLLGRDLRDKIPWGAQVWAIAELEWMKLGSQAWVQMSAVPQLNWYSVPSAPKAVKAGSPSSSLNEVPTETQKAVPIGR